MTVPVTMRVTPGTTRRTMAFYIPHAYQSNPPKPSDPAVVLEKRAAFTAYVKSFGGFANRRLFQTNFDALKAAINNPSAYRTDYFYGVGYDQPLKLWNRRNEVWLVKK